MIDLHFDRTPNCWKVAIMLEEVPAPHRIVKYDLFAGDHLDPSFGKINPNFKLPAIVDHAPDDGRGPVTVAETAAILVYLAEKHGCLLPSAARERAPVLQWVSWQVSGLGPMIGQASHFIRYAPETIEYGVRRYQNESRRLMAVLDGVLARHAYVAGDYSIADIAIWPWANFVEQIGIGIDLIDYPHVKRWGDSIALRPAVQRVFTNPETAADPRYLQTKRTLSAAEWSNLYGERMLGAPAEARVRAVEGKA